ncbi:hypothetical protein M501DRAFT_982994 [Patellaria atrata CBS 101060]|uniref:Zn(2)-C6 fungal-type domain-containing protein n=1 Tax=Patellaria atrata CBS 101060 TaxID=1346257 RepID=A0A9P4VMW1_9PEZI|nr:hypothetical protein M501DRAFT_982994 [Patellaria atrata CBS 101060]
MPEYPPHPTQEQNAEVINLSPVPLDDVPNGQPGSSYLQYQYDGTTIERNSKVWHTEVEGPENPSQHIISEDWQRLFYLADTIRQQNSSNGSLSHFRTTDEYSLENFSALESNAPSLSGSSDQSMDENVSSAFDSINTGTTDINGFLPDHALWHADNWIRTLPSPPIGADTSVAMHHTFPILDTEQNGAIDFPSMNAQESTFSSLTGTPEAEHDLSSLLEYQITDPDIGYAQSFPVTGNEQAAAADMWLNGTGDYISLNHSPGTDYAIQFPDLYSPLPTLDLPHGQLVPHVNRLNLDITANNKVQKEAAEGISEREGSLTRNAHTSPLKIVQQDGKGNITANAELARPAGGRRGPLPKHKIKSITKTRREKSVCIKCRLSKVSCTGGSPCERCRNISRATVWEQPCLKAHFHEIVRSGACNYVSQRQIHHLTSDGNSRVNMPIADTFALGDLLSQLENKQDQFNIRARSLCSCGPLYTLDLSKTYRFLSRIQRRHNISRDIKLQDFINTMLHDSTGWQKCIDEPNNTADVLNLLFWWTTMPSRAIYDRVPLSTTSAPELMDIEDSAQTSDILLAAQLSRIIIRALELQAFETLQKNLNASATSGAGDLPKLVRQLGRLLLTLRWRVAWWKLYGDGSGTDEEAKMPFVERAEELVKVLYFYYWGARRKLPSWVDEGERGFVQSCYGDARFVADRLPGKGTIEGFEAWMREGEGLVEETKAVQK